MKTINLDIIKKNRVYFKCKNERGYEVKLKVTSKSENLLLGKQDLLVRDVSVRTKYGTDIIYDLENEIKSDRIITLQSRYNYILVYRCKALGGRWDPESKSWVFSDIVADEVEKLDELFNNEIITIEITAKENQYGSQDAVYFAGYRIAKATGRDSDAILCDGISMISGRIGSGGSMKNWTTVVIGNSVFRLQISRGALEFADLDKWDVKIIES